MKQRINYVDVYPYLSQSHLSKTFFIKYLLNIYKKSDYKPLLANLSAFSLPELPLCPFTQDHSTSCWLQSLQEKSNVEIITDSMYVKNGITQWIQKWKENFWKTKNNKRVKNKDLWLILDNLCSQHDVEWSWVKGHSGNSGNEKADKLANKGL